MVKFALKKNKCCKVSWCRYTYFYVVHTYLGFSMLHAKCIMHLSFSKTGINFPLTFHWRIQMNTRRNMLQIFLFKKNCIKHQKKIFLLGFELILIEEVKSGRWSRWITIKVQIRNFVRHFWSTFHFRFDINIFNKNSNWEEHIILK